MKAYVLKRCPGFTGGIILPTKAMFNKIRVLSDRENRENREKSGNLVGREKSGKSQGICCLDREKIIKAFYSSNRYPVYLTYDVILCSCCIYVIVHISFHLF